MSLPVAIRSVLFYVLACTPCAEVLHRRKAKNTAKSERKEKARFVAEQPHLHHQPDPFTTNPYWEEEIRLGPTMKKAKNGKYIKGNAYGSKEMGSKEGSSKSGSSVTAPGSVLRPSTTTERPSTTQEAAPTKPPPTHPLMGSSPTMVEEDTASDALSKMASVSTGVDWNRQRYQREDEELWGRELSRTGQKLMDAIKEAGTAAGRFVESKLGIEKPVTEEDRHNFYFAPRNPPVNDYHPPVVRSKPQHVDDLRWMLQPPPSAKIMEARVPVSRTTSTISVGSRRTAPGTSDGRSMQRRVGEKALEAKLRNGEHPHAEQNTIPTTSILTTSIPPTSPQNTRPRRGTASSTQTPSSTQTLSQNITPTTSPRKTQPRRGTASSTQTQSRHTTYSTSDSDESEEETYRPRSRPQPQRRNYVSHIVHSSEESEDEYISNRIESLSKGFDATAPRKQRQPTIPSSDPKRSISEPALRKPLEDIGNIPFGGEDMLASADSAVGLHLP